MRENKNQGLSIEELAEHFGYSKFHFSREFKKKMGASPNEYWAALRAIDREPIVFPLTSNQETVQVLREKVLDDPEITINPVRIYSRMVCNSMHHWNFI